MRVVKLELWTTVNSSGSSMRIGELAKKAGVSRDTIRFYERNGLIRSNVDTEADNTYRNYPDAAVLTIEVVRNAQAAGLSIADIRVFMGQTNIEPSPDFDATAFLDTKIEEVKARTERALRFLEMLQDTRARAGGSKDAVN